MKKYKTTIEEFNENLLIIKNKLNEYFHNSCLGEGKVLIQNPPEDTANILNLDYYIKNGGLLNENFSNFLENYLKNTLHLHNPRFIGHQNAQPDLSNGLAELINNIVNNPGSIYEMSPVGLVIEKTIIHWLLSKIGWYNDEDLCNFKNSQNTSGGVITHGGSLANLHALLVARSAVFPDSWQNGNPQNAVVICSQSAHYSMLRAVSILGLGSQALELVPVNEKDQLKVEVLPEIVKKIQEKGKQILCLVANAGITSSGMFDDLYNIGKFCQSQSIWYHVDAAHGGCVLNSAKHKQLMQGVDLADSLIWDMHKMMQTSSLCTALLVKKNIHLQNALQQKGSYIFFKNEIDFGLDTISYSIECTKAQTATRFFYVLASQGEKGLENYVEDLFARAEEFYNYLITDTRIICPFKPQSNIVCFRFLDENKIPNAEQLRLRQEIIKDGNFHITSTEINKIRYLRLSIMNSLTKLDHLKELINQLAEYAEKLFGQH